MNKDYAIACASLAIIASSLAIIYVWISGLYMCIKSRFLQLRVTELLIGGTLLIGKLFLNKFYVKAYFINFQGRRIKCSFFFFFFPFLLISDCITVVIWVVMLAKNLDGNNVITTNQIGWSLWLAVGSTGGFLLALVLFCIHRIDIGASPYSKRHENYAESREYLQRF